ncbi:FitA-like ribbon-helix-helix domain-containing protein [Thiocapsa rosea]|uniref:Plasmid stability protein n=1 Tax=Thiocapsa rosea TaxID=69360 RepID=A0A495V9A7_9GAMM|nr:Arc family DNA-binding protein [Thiocapsa rosea]RKT45971.1 plasmid stability protein [Thiocapsa rosea]
MATLTVRNLPDDVHRALRLRAAEHGRSTEGEVRAILAEAVKTPEPRRLGDALAALGREVGLTDDEITMLEASRDRTTAAPVNLD